MQTNTGTAVEGSASIDAIEMLKQDHRTVEQLFARWEGLREGGVREDRALLLRRLCDELDIHAAIEEEIFYPATQQGTGDVDGIAHAKREHAEAKRLVADLRKLQPDDPQCDTTVRMLRKAVEEHVTEEEEKLFTEARGRLDTVALGAQMMSRKQVLQTQIVGTGGRTQTP